MSENIAAAIAAKNEVIAQQGTSLDEVAAVLETKAAGGTDISLGLTSATVGQTVKVKAIDASGKPTAWEAANMAGENDYKKLKNLPQINGVELMGNKTGEELGLVPDLSGYATKDEIPVVPESLPNPNALTFTGAVTGSYDGSAPMSVEIPSGGGGSGETWEAINAITLSDAVNTVTINTDSGGNAIALKKVRILVEGSATHNQDLFLNGSRYIRAQVVGSKASVGALSAEPFCGNMYCYAVTNINANYGFSNQIANIFSDEITITDIKLIVNNAGTFSAGTKFTIQGVRA